MLSTEQIIPYLADKKYTAKLRVYDTLASTNDTAKELARGGCEHGTAVIADSQTAGRGRMGKSFYSPSGGGVYISFIFRAEFLKLTEPTPVTVAAAVVVAGAIRRVCGCEPEIKWVNDILLHGKKICGILTEGMTGADGGVEWVILGIGINVTTEDFPAEIKETAGAIAPGGDESLRTRLAAELINIFLSSDEWHEPLSNEGA